MYLPSFLNTPILFCRIHRFIDHDHDIEKSDLDVIYLATKCIKCFSDLSSRMCTFKKEQKGIKNFYLQTNDITNL